jgi:RNA polymerase sigma factor (sigma-70 family)
VRHPTPMLTTCAARELFRAVLRPEYDHCSDGQLLSAFVERRDEIAFEGLMRRHGPMVLGVCRRLLPNPPDAEDAFQATFLILAHKAEAVSPPDRVAGWLYGVARKTALKARDWVRKRQRRERLVAEVPDVALPPESADPDLAQRIEAELTRLAEDHRTVLLLCDVEGLTRATVARRLGVPEGTVSSRLARAREALADRLKRIGISPSALASAGILPAQLSQPLLTTVMDAAVWSCGGALPAGAAVSPAVLALKKGVLNAMFLQRLKPAGAALLIVLTLCIAGVLLRPARAEEKDKPAKKDEKQAEKKAAFALKDAWLEEVDERYWIVTVSYTAPKAVGGGLVRVVDKIPEKPDTIGGPGEGYIVRNRLVNITVSEEARITDEKGKKIRLKTLKAELTPPKDKKGKAPVIPVALEFEADEGGLVIVSITKKPPYKWIAPKDLRPYHHFDLKAVDLKNKTISVTATQDPKAKERSYTLDEKVTKVYEKDLNDGKTRALKLDDLQVDMKLNGLTLTQNKDKKLIVSMLVVLKEPKAAKDEKKEKKKDEKNSDEKKQDEKKK